MVNSLVFRLPKPFFFMVVAAHAACLICVHGKCRLINILYVYGLNGNVGNEWYLTGKRRLINVPFIGSYEKYTVHIYIIIQYTCDICYVFFCRWFSSRTSFNVYV